jgi:DNA-binding NtrC family response regulator
MSATLQSMLVGAPAVYAPDGMAALRVLIVTDDAGQMAELALAFQHSGVKLLTQAGDYRTAFAALEGGRFDVVVHDIDLGGADASRPGADGALFMQRAGAQKEQQFVLLGGSGKAALTTAAATAVDLGIILLGVLEKPFSMVQFGHLLDSVQGASM